MFTGIIREIGIVAGFERSDSGCRLSIRSKKIYEEAGIGDSVSVNGVCLTVTARENTLLYFDVMGESASRTNISSLRPGDSVNLESPLKPSEHIGGHFVLGHVDCTGRIKGITKRDTDVIFDMDIPDEFASLIVEKGSIALDGISLTIADVKDKSFTVHIIPHTLKETTLGAKSRGDKLNVEFDIIGKYILRFKELARSSRLNEEFLKEKGFL